MTIHLVNGTSELLRHFHTLPPAKNREGEEVAAVRGVMYSIRGLVQDGATHIGIAIDREGGERLDPAVRSQFPIVEEGLRAWGLAIWLAEDCDANDVLASAAAKFAADSGVEQVMISTPDKELAQCVHGTRVVQRDRVRKTTRDEAGIVEKYGVPPASIPDYLALVGDGSERVPGLAGWGPKSAATLLARFGRIEAIPDDHGAWGVRVARAASLAATLAGERPQALTYRQLSTLRIDVPVSELAEDLRWRGPTPALPAFRRRMAQYDA
jgi:5'-3' exonuclease